MACCWLGGTLYFHCAFGAARTAKAQFGELAQDVDRQSLGLVPLRHPGRHLSVSKVARNPLELTLLVSQTLGRWLAKSCADQ